MSTSWREKGKYSMANLSAGKPVDAIILISLLEAGSTSYGIFLFLNHIKFTLAHGKAVLMLRYEFNR